MIELKLEKRLSEGNEGFEINIDHRIESGSLVAIYGVSGAGKTSLLRLISGLLSPDAGKVVVDENTWYNAEENINLPTQKREIGFVFQDYALFPNMSIRENIAYGIPKNEKKEWIDELIQIIKLEDIQDRFPNTLSGGQKQRVALARALARKPSILLLDEPLSALDNKIRSELQDYILLMHKKLALTTFMVSHDIGEISKMADSVMLMKNGKIERTGDALSLFTNRQISGKFQFSGEIIAIQPSDVIYIVTVLIGKNIVKVVVDERTAIELNVGDKVMVVSKAFNPLIYKINTP
jgi:molybdate transport system ATP-binding protein